MFHINENYQKLPGSYLFSTIGKKVNAYQEANPDKEIIRLGIGDVTQPIAPAIIEAMHKAVDEMGHAETFHGYAPDLGYAFLRKAIVDNDYKAKGCDISEDEIFVSDGAKSDSANIQEIFAQNNRIAVCDPVYPVYVDSNVMAGRTGTYDKATETWSDVIYMPCTAANNFVPEFPKETPDIIYLCLPNNPTGTYVNSAKVEEFIRKLPDHVIPVVDEAYFEYVEDPTHYSLIKMIQEGYDRPLFVLRTFSKIYGMAGLRIGYTFADPLLIDELMKACQAWNVSYNALAAAQAALKDQEYIKKIKALTTAGREYLEDELTKLGCTLAKPCANFIYFDTHHDPKEIRAALAERKIMISAFGFNRVSVGTEEQNKAFIAALKEILAAY